MVAGDGSGTVYLTFTFGFDNKGAGPMIVSGHRADTTRSSMIAHQKIKRSDGSFLTRARVGKVTWLPSRKYQRWGFTHQSYALVSAKTGSKRKAETVGLCLEDNRNTPRSSQPGEPKSRVFHTRCGKGKPNLLEIDLGLSLGWRNLHLAKRDGQLIDLTKLPSGEYVLVGRANAAGSLAETTTKNNAASARVSITWVAGRKLPKVEVIKSCDDSATCS
jgi:hypothetical protein